MVIILHVSASRWYSVDVYSTEWEVFNLYDSAVRSCVPIFFMLSGKLYLSKSKMISIKELVGNKILKLFI